MATPAASIVMFLVASVLGQSFGLFIYLRNLVFIWRRRRKAAAIPVEAAAEQ